uniref:Ig-like domain-containing protein n=1 Tax=Lepisosteus oculatus TaxID=7918 RepID=W5LW81_LEPOC
ETLQLEKGMVSESPVGSSVVISCTTSNKQWFASGYSALHWYLQKPGQAPQLLVYAATNKCSGSGSGTAFTLTITGVQAEDAGDYYCQQDYNFPFTQCVWYILFRMYVSSAIKIQMYSRHTVAGTEGQITMTLTPATVSVSPEQDVSLQCSASQGISWSLTWYQLKPGHSPRLLIKAGDERFHGVPTHFGGSRSGTVFTFKITGVQAEDAGDYYCQQYDSTQPSS